MTEHLNVYEDEMDCPGCREEIAEEALLATTPTEADECEGVVNRRLDDLEDDAEADCLRGPEA